MDVLEQRTHVYLAETHGCIIIYDRWTVPRTRNELPVCQGLSLGVLMLSLHAALYQFLENFATVMSPCWIND